MKTKFFIGCLVLLLIGLVIFGAMIAMLRFFTGKQMEMQRFDRLNKQVAVVNYGLEQWASDNDGKFPDSLPARSKKNGKLFFRYFNEHIDPSYPEGNYTLSTMITFLHSSAPIQLEHGQHKPGSIEVYVFGNNMKCVVVGYGYEKQPIIRSDSKEFREYYSEYLKYKLPIR